MKILGIETSCDETSAAIINVDDNKLITMLSNIVSSSMSLHSQTGGIIPEVAAREQIKYIIPVIDNAFAKANEKINKKDIDVIAVTYGPGLIGSLLVGVETAKTLSLAWNTPIIPVNHLLGHIYANFIGENQRRIAFPALALIVSGGHTDLVLLESHQKITWLGGTRDDAAGEAFDKVGRLLNLPYPAGHMIEKLAKKGNPKRFRFPRPLMYNQTLDFSFSGLKTAIHREIQKIISLDQQTVYDLAYATQDAIIDVLVHKTLQAAKQYTVSSILLGGGVSANQTLVDTLKQSVLNSFSQTKFFVPTKNLCTDNAAMIAAAAIFHNTSVPWHAIKADPELYFETT